MLRMLVGLVLVASLPAARMPVRLAAQTRDTLKPAIQNDRVTVWDVTWTKGASGGFTRRNHDVVVLYLSNGSVKLVRPDGNSITVPASVGEVVFQPKGSVKDEEGASNEPVRAKVIDLNDHYVAPLKNTSGYPNAFPRPGSKKLLDNKRVVVWDYTFTAGTASPMHFHEKDVVVTYMAEGSLRSTTPDGQSQVSEYTFGLTKFNARNRTHSEQLVQGKQRVIAVELK